MGSFCGGGSNNKQTTTETSALAKLDPLTDQIKRIALSRGLDIMNQSYPGYDWRSRTAGFTPDQNKAFGLIRGFNDPSNSRIIDEGGSLGKISDYMNPYLNQALAPAIRDIERTGQKQRNDIGAAATMSNAFGDARHGVVESGQMRGEEEAVGDLSAQMRDAGWNNAMALRAGDRSNQVGMAQALLGAGGMQQDLGQRRLDAKYGEFQTAREWPFRQLDAILSILSGSPNAQSSTSTSTTTQPGSSNNWLMQILGGLAGSAFKGSMGMPPI